MNNDKNLNQKIVKKKKITNKSSMTPKKLANKRVTWKDDYFNHGFMRLKPVDKDWLERLGEQFVEWCAETRNKRKLRRFSLERWLEEKGISKGTLEGWRKRNKRLNESIKFGMMIIGNRLEEGIITKEYSERYVTFTLHHYLERHDKNNRYHADLKNVKDIVAALFGKTFENVNLDESNR